LSDRKHTRPTVRGGVVVIGLGRFGSRLAESLEHLGQEVLAIDDDPEIVQHWSQRLTYVVQADSTDNLALQQIGVPDFQRVVVSIGSDVEASVLTVLALVEIGVGDIWATASSRKHEKILSSVGARHVVYPEAAMGERVAHLITSNMLDYIEFDGDLGIAIAKTRIPAEVAGRTLAESGLRRRYGVTVVGVKRPGEAFEYGAPDSRIPPDALVIVAGTIDQVRRFAAAT